jgi:DNA (cytosine-5)-methyltransferase 1
MDSRLPEMRGADVSKRPRKILVADLLCGAGGSSTGAARALAELGLEMELVCVNHWPVAIETHTKNHPQARHHCQDIATVRPHLIVPEGYLDLLMATPTCTHHSVARGGKPTSDQQRSDPWHIITWLTELRVKRMIIENVWEFCGWGPVDARTGKPIQSRKGEYFRAWIDTIRRLGFDPEWRKLNAADYGDATTRQRFILMARSDSRSVSWPMPTHAKRAEGLALFPTQKPWKPAREIIDWSIKGNSIFNRKKPLAPKTLARIYAGAQKFNWPEPFLVVLRNHMAGQSLDQPLPTIAANGGHIALAQPFLVKQNFRRDVQGVDDPTPTIMTVARLGLAEPFILNRNGEGYGETRAHSIDAPAPTASCRGAGYIVEPFVLSRHGEGAPRSIEEPTPTQVAKHSHCLISPYYGSGSGETCQSAEVPLATVTSKGRFGMVVPVTHTQGNNSARDIDEPLPTVTTAKGGEFAMVMPVTHADNSDRVRAPDEPLPTVTGANRGELAFITAQFGEREGQAPRVHDVEQPTPAICATGHINLVEATPQYDILFRMLEPHELAAAMGFDGEDAAYEFAGTKTEKVKQIGNAVSVSKMKACVGAIMADAAIKRPIEGALPLRAAE